MIDVRPGTSTVGIQCSIWDKPPDDGIKTTATTATKTLPCHQPDIGFPGAGMVSCDNTVSEEPHLDLQITNLNQPTVDQPSLPSAKYPPHVRSVRSSSDKRSRRLDDESYGLLVDMLTGRFNIPVRQRTTKQRAAVVRLWRNRGHYTVDSSQPENLYLNGKRVLRESELDVLVTHYKESVSKKHGARQIKKHLGEAFAGLTEKRILQVTRRGAHDKDNE